MGKGSTPKGPTPAQIWKARQCFRPKVTEMKDSCASCPFRENNDAEFGDIIFKLGWTDGQELSGIALSIATNAARREIKADCDQRGDFMCHCSVYNPDMSKKPVEEHRQCSGATAWFKRKRK